MKKLFIMLSLVVATTLSANAQLDLGALFGKVKEAATEAAGDAIDEVVPEEIQSLLGIAIPELEIPGTWSYVDVAVEFESTDALTNAGGVVAAETVEQKLAPMLAKVGIKEGAFTFTFNEDGSVSTTLGKKNVKGTWKYDKKSESVTLGLSGKEFTTRMTESGDNINILFKADKLLELIKTLSSKSSNSTLVAVAAIAKSYDGMNIGFECEKIKK